MNRKPAVVASILIALCAYSAGAAAQPVGQGQRDQKAADAMEKERLKAEAKPVQAYIPPPKAQPAPTDNKPVMTKAGKPPKVFTAVAPAKPGDKPAKKDKKKTKAKKDA